LVSRSSGDSSKEKERREKVYKNRRREKMSAKEFQETLHTEGEEVLRQGTERN